MKISLSEQRLEELLNMLRTPEMPAELNDHILQHTAVLPQKQAMGERFGQLVVDVLRDIFGQPGDVPFYNVKWRIGGAFVALLLGFSTGYLSDWSIVEEQEAAYYAIYDTEESDLI